MIQPRTQCYCTQEGGAVSRFAADRPARRSKCRPRTLVVVGGEWVRQEGAQSSQHSCVPIWKTMASLLCGHDHYMRYGGTL